QRRPRDRQRPEVQHREAKRRPRDGGRARDDRPGWEPRVRQRDPAGVRGGRLLQVTAAGWRGVSAPSPPGAEVVAGDERMRRDRAAPAVAVEATRQGGDAMAALTEFSPLVS